MSEIKYLIAGSGHAGLSAIESIRIHDKKGSISLLTPEKHLPYSPTILPYVVSGLVEADKAALIDEAALDQFNVDFKRESRVISMDPSARSVGLESGETLFYENLLLATGAQPVLPPVKGLKDVSYHVLRTLDDALRLQGAAQQARSIIILGGGLIGMHAAESLANNKRAITVIEALPAILAGYFDERASSLIRQVFCEHGVTVHTGDGVTHVAEENGRCTVSLASGTELVTDLLLVAAGVTPRTGYCSDAGIDRDEGIIVDEMMRSSDDHIWAAGDVAQAPSFFGGVQRVNAILPNAVEQGRIAGMGMAGDPALKPFRGGLAMNTFGFLGHRAFSVGLGRIPESEDGFEVEQVFQPNTHYYQKLIFKNDRLVGVLGINSDVDPGTLRELIRRKVDLKDVKTKFIKVPGETARVLMSRLWR